MGFETQKTITPSTGGDSNIRFKLSDGKHLSVTTAGNPQNPAVLLLHGFPSSARTFRDIIPVLAQSSFVIAPDLPGFGASDTPVTATFDAFAEAVSELLAHLEVGPRFIYLHDFGAPVGLRIAMDSPDLALGLIIQNANAHRSGFGPQWKDTLDFWAHPNPQNEAAATAHLTLEGVRDQYVAGVPEEIAERISPSVWEEDWRVMCLPGRKEVQRGLVADYANHVSRFDAISDYLHTEQPPALMIWGRHDAFFDIAETVSWMQDLPRMEGHILDAGHFLLETDAPRAASLIQDFIANTLRKQRTPKTKHPKPNHPNA